MPGDYVGPVKGYTGDLEACFFLKPNARDDDAPRWARSIQHVCFPPHTYRECADGWLEIRASIGDTAGTRAESDGWHGEGARHRGRSLARRGRRFCARPADLSGRPDLPRRTVHPMYPNTALSAWQLTIMAIIPVVTLVGWLIAIYVAAREPGGQHQASGWFIPRWISHRRPRIPYAGHGRRPGGWTSLHRPPGTYAMFSMSIGFDDFTAQPAAAPGSSREEGWWRHDRRSIQARDRRPDRPREWDGRRRPSA